MRRFALLLFFGLALGQTLLPVEELGLTFREEGGAWVYPVSYTHLTLPTICSV